MYKNNSQFSGDLKGYNPLQLFCNLTGECHVEGYLSYTNRWRALIKNGKH
jgi:hypothetical protein